MFQWTTITILVTFLMLVSTLAGTAAIAGENLLTDAEKRASIEKMYRDYKNKFPEVKDISADEALTLSAMQQVLFVDVRESGEKAVSKIAGAVTKEYLLEDPTLLEGKTAVAYCTIGYRSGVFAEKMADMGVSVTNLSGGILAWVHAGGKIYDDAGESKRVHVVGKKWDLAPQDYETVVFGFWEMLSYW